MLLILLGVVAAAIIGAGVAGAGAAGAGASGAAGPAGAGWLSGCACTPAETPSSPQERASARADRFAVLIIIDACIGGNRGRTVLRG